MAHGVYSKDKVNGERVPLSSVILKNVEKNLMNLRGYSFITIDEAERMLTGSIPMRKRCLVLTFDDSLKCHVEVMAPKLEQWGIPATFYISTDIIEHRRPYWWLRLEYAVSKIREHSISVILPNDKRFIIYPAQKWELRRKLTIELYTSFKPSQCDKVVESVEAQIGISSKGIENNSPYAGSMTWEDVRELDDKGFTIGSHTCSHPNLALLRSEELRFELEQSKRILEKVCKKPCRHLSYPHSQHTDEVCAAARAAGYATAVTTVFAYGNFKGDDLFRLRRFPLPKPAYKLPFELCRFEVSSDLAHLNP